MSLDLYDGVTIFMRCKKKAEEMDLHLQVNETTRAFAVFLPGMDQAVSPSIKLDRLEMWLEGFSAARDHFTHIKSGGRP